MNGIGGKSHGSSSDGSAVAAKKGKSIPVRQFRQTGHPHAAKVCLSNLAGDSRSVAGGIQLMREYGGHKMAVFPHRKILLLAAAGLLTGSLAAQTAKENAAPKEAKDAVTRLRIEVTGGEKSLAVDSASVYVKYPQERTLAKDKMIEMNVKTNREGLARIPGVPRGKVLVQVIAPGWKTFGQWFDLKEDEQVIKINLQKPPRWY
jgi:hypothetical protein